MKKKARLERFTTNNDDFQQALKNGKDFEQGTYKPKNIEDIIQEILECNKMKINDNKYYQHYHLMPTIGWMNDPNGLCQFKGVYHIYYQYSPTSPSGANKCWGHYTTTNFIDYVREPIFLLPDNIADKDGVFSGTAFIEDNKINFFYTGNVEEAGCDLIYEGREQNTIKVISEDGYSFDKKECLLKNEDYPNYLSCHVRDPKIIKVDNLYYLVLGARTNDDKGCVLLFKSKTLNNFEFAFEISTKDKFGYMWECPDIFSLNNTNILLTCPQGVKTNGYKYENIYQNGYFVLDDDYFNNHEVTTFHELDLGFDFYAPQTFTDDKNRRILIGWMGLPDIDYNNEPTISNNWQHCMTIPRILQYKDNNLYQKPLDELKALRDKEIDFNNQLENNIYELYLEFSNEFKIELRSDTIIKFENGLFSLQFGKHGNGRAVRHLEIEKIDNLRIFSDSSSLEIFINDGYKTMTSRVYDEDTGCKITNANKIEGYYLNSFNIKQND